MRLTAFPIGREFCNMYMYMYVYTFIVAEFLGGVASENVFPDLAAYGLQPKLLLWP